MANLKPSYTLSTRLPSSLRALEISCGTLRESLAWTYILAAVSQAPLLEELTIIGYIDPLVCLHITSFTKLRQLDLSDADFGPFDLTESRTGLQGILGMESLVDIALPRNLASYGVPCGAGSIQNDLRTIDLGGNASAINKVLVSLSNPAIEEITVHSHAISDALSSSLWKMCLGNICMYRHVSLRRLVFNWMGTSTGKQPFETMKPLLQLTRLEEYVNTCNMPISLDDLTAIATSWPEIRRLTLNLTILLDGEPGPEKSQIWGLVPFSRHCLKLQTLNIKFSYKSPLPDSSEFPLLSHSLRELRVEDPGMEQYVQLAILIDRIFPSLDNVIVGSGGSRWVSQMITAFQNIRRESRSVV